MKTRILVVCEGSSEEAYIQELNRYLGENDIDIAFTAYPANTGEYTKVIRKYKQTYIDNKRTKIIIWIDKDRYIRNDGNCKTNYTNKSKNIPDFLFSYMNFEDIISMHDAQNCMLWQNICSTKSHFSTPLHEREYIKDFITIYPRYSKGSIPFKISSTTLNVFFRNQNNNSIKFKCDFADFLISILPNPLP